MNMDKRRRKGIFLSCVYNTSLEVNFFNIWPFACKNQQHSCRLKKVWAVQKAKAQECGRVGKCHLYPDHSFLDISSTPEGNTNIQALQLNLPLNSSPPEEMLLQLLTAVSVPGAEPGSCRHLRMLYPGSCWIPKNQILPWALVESVCKGSLWSALSKCTQLRLGRKAEPAEQLPFSGNHPHDVHTEEQQHRCLFWDTFNVGFGPGDFAIHFCSALKYVPSVDIYIILLFQLRHNPQGIHPAPLPTIPPLPCLLSPHITQSPG